MELLPPSVEEPTSAPIPASTEPTRSPDVDNDLNSRMSVYRESEAEFLKFTDNVEKREQSNTQYNNCPGLQCLLALTTFLEDAVQPSSTVKQLHFKDQLDGHLSSFKSFRKNDTLQSGSFNYKHSSTDYLLDRHTPSIQPSTVSSKLSDTLCRVKTKWRRNTTHSTNHLTARDQINQRDVSPSGFSLKLNGSTKSRIEEEQTISQDDVVENRDLSRSKATPNFRTSYEQAVFSPLTSPTENQYTHSHESLDSSNESITTNHHTSKHLNFASKFKHSILDKITPHDHDKKKKGDKPRTFRIRKKKRSGDIPFIRQRSQSCDRLEKRSPSYKENSHNPLDDEITVTFINSCNHQPEQDTKSDSSRSDTASSSEKLSSTEKLQTGKGGSDVPSESDHDSRRRTRPLRTSSSKEKRSSIERGRRVSPSRAQKILKRHSSKSFSAMDGTVDVQEPGNGLDFQTSFDSRISSIDMNRRRSFDLSRMNSAETNWYDSLARDGPNTSQEALAGIEQDLATLRANILSRQSSIADITQCPISRKASVISVCVDSGLIMEESEDEMALTQLEGVLREHDDMMSQDSLQNTSIESLLEVPSDDENPNEVFSCEMHENRSRRNGSTKENGQRIYRRAPECDLPRYDSIQEKNNEQIANLETSMNGSAPNSFQNDTGAQPLKRIETEPFMVASNEASRSGQNGISNDQKQTFHPIDNADFSRIKNLHNETNLEVTGSTMDGRQLDADGNDLKGTEPQDRIGIHKQFADARDNVIEESSSSQGETTPNFSSPVIQPIQVKTISSSSSHLVAQENTTPILSELTSAGHEEITSNHTLPEQEETHQSDPELMKSDRSMKITRQLLIDIEDGRMEETVKRQHDETPQPSNASHEAGSSESYISSSADGLNLSYSENCENQHSGMEDVNTVMNDADLTMSGIDRCMDIKTSHQKPNDASEDSTIDLTESMRPELDIRTNSGTALAHHKHINQLVNRFSHHQRGVSLDGHQPRSNNIQPKRPSIQLDLSPYRRGLPREGTVERTRSIFLDSAAKSGRDSLLNRPRSLAVTQTNFKEQF